MKTFTNPSPFAGLVEKAQTRPRLLTVDRLDKGAPFIGRRSSERTGGETRMAAEYECGPHRAEKCSLLYVRS